MSHTTGGISRTVSPYNLVKTFLTDFSMPRNVRKLYLLQENATVRFHLTPSCCPEKTLTSAFFACSVCMHVYCPMHADQLKKCAQCHFSFDTARYQPEPMLEYPLKVEENPVAN